MAERTCSGLRLDQAAAAFLLLTSPRRAELLVGPAGSGKTRTVAHAARGWKQAGMGEVVELTTSQQARNVLARAGVDRACNTARFPGHHQSGGRQFHGPRPVSAGNRAIRT